MSVCLSVYVVPSPSIPATALVLCCAEASSLLHGGTGGEGSLAGPVSPAAGDGGGSCSPSNKGGTECHRKAGAVGVVLSDRATPVAICAHQ